MFWPTIPQQDANPQATDAVRHAIRTRNIRELQALIVDGEYVEPLYIDATTYILAKNYMPEAESILDEHMRKAVYGY